MGHGEEYFYYIHNIWGWHFFSCRNVSFSGFHFSYASLWYFLTFLLSPSAFPHQLLPPSLTSAASEARPCYFAIMGSVSSLPPLPMQRLPLFLWPPASWSSLLGLGVAQLCSTSRSPPGPITAPPGLPRLLNVVMATNSQWAQETPRWARTGRKRHWAASAGADKAKVLGRPPPPTVRKERGKCQNHISSDRSTRKDSWPDRTAGRLCIQALVGLHV